MPKYQAQYAFKKPQAEHLPWLFSRAVRVRKSVSRAMSHQVENLCKLPRNISDEQGQRWWLTVVKPMLGKGSLRSSADPEVTAQLKESRGRARKSPETDKGRHGQSKPWTLLFRAPEWRRVCCGLVTRCRRWILAPTMWWVHARYHRCRIRQMTSAFMHLELRWFCLLSLAPWLCYLLYQGCFGFFSHLIW